jgi:hypothetical protein
MQTVKVTGGTLRIAAGVKVGLSAESAARRAGRVTALGDGIFETVMNQDFKSGEVLAISLDDVPKHATAIVSVLDTAAAVSKAPVVTDMDDPDAAFAGARRRGRKA